MFNPAEASRNIKNEFIDYITTTYSFAEKRLQDQLAGELDARISRGPLLDIRDVFKTGMSLEELVREGVLSPLFRDLEAKKPAGKPYGRKLPLSRPLYLHQEQAIRRIVRGRNAVISTGTGSGKTNCFLIPVLNELLRERENGTLGPGVRALIIYPMNALANDQMKNIREILMFYPDITFGVYNGGTEYDEPAAVRVYKAMFAGEKIPELREQLPNEVLSRDRMKETPPNILITNYAMLEHLLFRPKDDVLFTNADFRFVVLDEAHVYAGATGIETSLLLRRLRARISATEKTQFILTSATLGSDESCDGDIVSFAENLCGADFAVPDVIRSTREPYNPPPVLKSHEPALYEELADESNFVRDVLERHGVPVRDGAPDNELLYDFISSSDLYDALRREVRDIMDIKDIAKLLSVSVDTAVSFVSLCNRAQKDGKSLMDARYHFFIRSLEGCFMTCGGKLFLDRRTTYAEGNEEYAVFETAVCTDCGKYAFVGRIRDDKLVQAGKPDEPVEYFFPAEDLNEETEDEETEGNQTGNRKDVFYLCPRCGAIMRADRSRKLPCGCGTGRYVKVVKAEPRKIGARCGNCRTGEYSRFYLGNDAATAVLATALYEELPETEYSEDAVSRPASSIFVRAVRENRKAERKRTGQFLAFSDSRQEAAKFACYLSMYYNEFLRRRGICRIIEEKHDEIIAQRYTIPDFVTKLTSFFSTRRTFAENYADTKNQSSKSAKNAWVAMLNELYRFSSPTSLTSLGMLQFEYSGNVPELISAIAEKYGVPEKSVRNLLNALAFEIVKAGAIYPSSDSDINDDDREYIFYSHAQRYVVRERDETLKHAVHWMPRGKKDSPGEFHMSGKTRLVCRTLHVEPREARGFLEGYFDYLTDPENNPHCLTDINKNGTYVMKAENFRVLINGDPDAHWYRCARCGKVTQFNLDSFCPSARCGGRLEETDPGQIAENNHFAKLYLSERMSPLFIKEHTAQLSKKESASYQERFINKQINALSCSTTFEMGVDVGELETVFLRNVPPLPSNYAQRAGRSGHSSVSSASFALTFAKLSSHDFAFFKQPEKMIKGAIMPPLFKTDNEKIVRRHIYATALSMFFADHEEMYNSNKASRFIDEKGYEIFLEWLDSHPDKLLDMLKKSIPDTENLHERIGINDFSWIESFSGRDGVFRELINEYERNVRNFEKQIKQLRKEGKTKDALSCEESLKAYRSDRLIDFLARGNILPRYGFPVDTVELYQSSSADENSRLRLSRDLQIAVAEYAPSSEVIADGKMLTSRYIRKSVVEGGEKGWHTAHIGICGNMNDGEECGAVNYSVTPIPEGGVKCPSCGKRMYGEDFVESIEPRSGFTAEKNVKPVPMRSQEKNYRSEDYYVGNRARKTIGQNNFKFNGIGIRVESTSNDSLLVLSSKCFYVCPDCGYGVAEDEEGLPKDVQNGMRRHMPQITLKHKSPFGKCENEVLKKRRLHHIFNTDVARISFDCDTSDYKTMISVTYALLNAISQDLNIERRDIRACLSRKIGNGVVRNSIVIYDSVPGGAGHSRRLVTTDGKMLYKIFLSALDAMKSCTCDPSCYNCLRCYENQKIHDILDRHSAIKFLSQFVGEIEVLGEKDETNN